MAIANSGYAGSAQSMVQTTKVVPSAVMDRPLTEIEAITAQMADTARRLSDVADRLRVRIDGFMQAEDTSGLIPTDPVPPPKSGTLGALRHWHGEIETQTNRLNAAVSNLAGIL